MNRNIDPNDTLDVDALNRAICEWADDYAGATRADNDNDPECPLDAGYGYRAMRDEPGETLIDFAALLGREPEPAEIAALWQYVREEGATRLCYPSPPTTNPNR